MSKTHKARVTVTVPLEVEYEIEPGVDQSQHEPGHDGTIMVLGVWALEDDSTRHELPEAVWEDKDSSVAQDIIAEIEAHEAHQDKQRRHASPPARD